MRMNNLKSFNQTLSILRFRFFVLVFSFTLVCSFLYGFVSSLTDRAEKAQASLSNVSAFDTEVSDYDESLAEELPRNVLAVSLGHDVELNGKKAKIVHFSSAHSVRSLLQEKVAAWQSRGVWTIGVGSKKRGMAVAINRSLGKRYLLSVWKVPENLRKLVSNGMPVQGILSVVDLDASNVSLEKVIKDFPVMPNAKEGSLISSGENGGVRTWTMSWTNPDSLEANLAFYRSELKIRGWKEVDKDAYLVLGANFGQLRFVRGDEETQIILSPTLSQARGDAVLDNETLVFATLGEKQ